MSEQVKLQAVNARYESAKKSQVVVWVLWIFGGVIGAHRYYLEDIGYAIAMTLLSWRTFGIWTIVDAFFINKRLMEKNRLTYSELARRYGVSSSAQPA